MKDRSHGKCPVCERADAQRPHLPFCSRRCRLVDLGRWLDGAYRVGTPLSQADDDDLAELPAEPEPSSQ